MLWSEHAVRRPMQLMMILLASIITNLICAAIEALFESISADDLLNVLFFSPCREEGVP
jgi:hypothetical protein